ncbi:MAG: tRNA (N(6)-L-threonylcarbamoyladenosine(37)-C(2))-methylthiotransferase MtaB [Desulfurobacteriaceae bacterium]
MKKVAFCTFGCKMNFFETAYMEEQFRKMGYEIVDFSEKADIYIINTCTVTKLADSKSRKAIRRAKRQNPSALVVATGCYSEVYKEEVEKVEEADLITGNLEKFQIVDLIEKRLKGNLPRICVKGVWNEKNFYPLTIRSVEGRTRAFLKIQQGCELFCSYCVIPKARGRMLSLPLDEVIKQVEELVDAGYKEIVLTGTHLGAYGIDLKENINLAKLLKKLIEVPNLYRIRISSVEPMEFDDELIEVVTSSEKIAPHLHIPLQSGSNRILDLMRRRYSREEYRNVIEKILTKNNEICIGTDVMVGFPTESDEDFEETRKLIEEIPFGYLHVFPYSPRKRTVAYKMGDTVHPSKKKERAEILRELGKEKSIAYRSRFIGKKLDGLVLEGKKVLTGNYITLKVDKEIKAGEIANVVLESIGEEREENYGKVI